VRLRKLAWLKILATLIPSLTSSSRAGEGGAGWSEADGKRMADQVFQCALVLAAVCCSVLQCVAVCCSVLPCVAVCCSVLQCVAVEMHS